METFGADDLWDVNVVNELSGETRLMALYCER